MSITFTCGEKWCNFANTNARALFDLAGIPGDLWTGQTWVEPSQLPDIQRRILKALNMEKVRKPHAREQKQHGRVIECEVTDESILRRLSELWAVIDHGIKMGVPLSWS